MALLSLLLAIAPAAQVDPVPELVVPGRYGAPVVSPDGRHVLLLDGRRAWLLDPQTLLARFELVNWGARGTAVLRGGELGGPAPALENVFVRVGGNLVRGDEYAAALGNREAGKR